MKVRLLTYTPNALDVLLYTKNTRLAMTGGGFDEVAAWPADRKAKELEYMRNTIQSSWEFVDYVFVIEDVTRAFVQQLTRHRVGTSFAAQAQRVVNMTGFRYLATGPLTTNGEQSEIRETGDPKHYIDTDVSHSTPPELYDGVMGDINTAYHTMVNAGIGPQDARGVLPTNVLTNLVFKANLRTLHDMALKRLCVKAQGEFQDVFRLMVDAVVAAHPWAADFLKVQCAWNGTCLFPTLPPAQCPVKPYVYDPVSRVSYGERDGMLGAHLASLDEIYQLHRAVRAEPQPVAHTVDSAPRTSHG